MKTYLSLAIFFTFALIILLMDVVKCEPNLAQGVFIGFLGVANMTFSYALSIELKKK